ncbi:MAG: alkaline phosphatase family protein [Candidatus Cybelea sp.]
MKALLALLFCTCLTACGAPFALRQGQGDTLQGDTFEAQQSTCHPEQRAQLCHPERSAERGVEGRRTTSPIKHVVFVIQENRSFNNLFMGYPGATTATYGYDKQGNTVKLTARRLWSSWDPGHGSHDFFVACDGQGKVRGTKCKMDGWSDQQNPPYAPKDLAYAYVPQDEIVPYWTIAKQYVLGDETFASNLDGSFVAHQYTVAAYASHAVGFPNGAWGCEGGKGDTLPTLTNERKKGPRIEACFDNPTIASEADAAGITWRSYAGTPDGDGGIWSAYQADRPIYGGADWSADVISPPAQFLTDVASGKLAAITWITPTWETSDHPSIDAKHGPAWIASVVDAIGESKFWKSTAIFVIWDDWGGWFDPVKPIYKDYDGLGFRVPLLIVSPYAKRGVVTHEPYETASVLRFIEDDFGLAPLAKSDARANDPAADPAAFDFHQRPRAFKKIAGAKSTPYWLELERQSSGHRMPDDRADGD